MSNNNHTSTPTFEFKNIAGTIIIDTTLEWMLLIKGRISEKWGLPKGHLEKGETHLQAALRETYEETGLKINLAVNILPCIISKRAKLFLVILPKDLTKLNPLDNNEILDIRWFKINQIQNIKYQTGMLKGLHNRMDYIIQKAACNTTNYNINTVFVKKTNTYIFNIYLYNICINNIFKKPDKILDIILSQFNRTFYVPELLIEIINFKKKYSKFYLNESSYVETKPKIKNIENKITIRIKTS